MSYWTGFTYATDWADYGSGYEPGSFKIDGDRVQLKGSVVYSGSGRYPVLITTLPSGLAPPNIELLSAPLIYVGGTNDGFVTYGVIEVDTSGNIYLFGPGTASAFPADQMLCLDGISFSVLS